MHFVHVEHTKFGVISMLQNVCEPEDSVLIDFGVALARKLAIASEKQSALAKHLAVIRLARSLPRNEKLRPDVSEQCAK